MRNVLRFGLISALLLLSLIIIAPSSFASNPKHTITLKGKVLQGSSKVTGATVVATCTWHTHTTSQSDTTGSNGKFAINFAEAVCDTGGFISVVATKGSKTATHAFTINPSSDDYVFDLSLHDSSPVPELGLLTGLGALLSSVGSFLVFKKHS